jgi:outer membrane protein assembly factor BamB
MSVTERFVWAVDKRRRLVAISRDDGRIAWRTEVGNLVGSAPAIGDGRLFLTDVDGRLLAYTSAEEAW